MGLKKHFACEFGQELNSEIVAEIKRLQEEKHITQAQVKKLNKERIRALGLVLIQGGKSDKGSR